jgi:hypothetical protein
MPTSWEVDVINDYVVYHYKVIDGDGNVVRNGSQVFKEGIPLPEEDWMTIPQDQYDALVALTQDARTAIANKEINGL